MSSASGKMLNTISMKIANKRYGIGTPVMLLLHYHLDVRKDYEGG